MPRQIPVPESSSLSEDRILLTGATGFLGSCLLAEWLKQPGIRVRCLLRAQSPEHARQRIDTALAPWGLNDNLLKADDPRIEVVCGDLSAPGFGLDAPPASLLQDVSAVLHCAAQVDLVRDYESLYPANVAATASLAKLCAANAIPFHHVSTLSVFVAQTPKPASSPEHTDLSSLDGDTLIHGGYAQSKFAADAWLQQQPSPHWIYRPGLVTGDSLTGHSPERDWLGSLIRGLYELGAVPAANAVTDQLLIDITPVDYVARSILALMHAEPGSFHLANPSPLSLSHLLAALCSWSRKQGQTLETLPMQTFMQRAHSYLRQSPTLRASAALLALCAALDPDAATNSWHSLNLFQASGIRLASADTEARLATAGLVCPPPDQDLLERYFKTSLEIPERVALNV